MKYENYYDPINLTMFYLIDITSLDAGAQFKYIEKNYNKITPFFSHPHLYAS